MKYECIWNAYPCWIIYLAQLSKCFLLKQSSELASLVHSSTSLVSPAHHSHLQREIGVSLLQWQELSLASGLALGIISHRILGTNGQQKKVESRQVSTLLLLWGSGVCAHEESGSFYLWQLCWSPLGVRTSCLLGVSSSALCGFKCKHSMLTNEQMLQTVETTCSCKLGGKQ